MRRVINRLGRVAVLNQLIGLAVVRIRLGIGNALSDQFLLFRIPYHNNRNMLGICVISHRISVIYDIRASFFCNGEGVGTCAVQRHLSEAAVYTLFICFIGVSGRYGQSQCFNGFLIQRYFVQLFQRVRQTIWSQFKIKLELKLLHRIARQQLFNIQLDFDLALVAYSDLVRFLSLGFCRQFQHKCGLVISKSFS